MRYFNVIIIFYILISALLGAVILSFSFNLLEINELLSHLNAIYSNLNARIALGAGGVLFIFISLLLAQITSVKREREKTIAFNNPSGQVTITLFAVEDLIRKIGQELPPIKEIKSDVIATKKRGIQVNIRLILRSETNIPEFTAQLQETVKSRIQEVFGIDESIIVRIHVAKIVTQQEKPKKKNEVALEDTEIKVPYPRI
ncbi:MAG: alkaline shock response membrane anchor protein AmaP [Candidatus Omnitrophica bacterium]|nr:alkaline shock response membrane anchor protein AmaP [Candidatus Omnitrophota bacterium]MDD5352298.1 alkaline shock response membrane anchor protein AmaP [Candidatus Omnitrophota bacterium]MDD5549896.1 alkaline shock response membrane anchor protein AmaP [Candidatus Omnitrophota bacterium]